jgi:hypothetical protein
VRVFVAKVGVINTLRENPTRVQQLGELPHAICLSVNATMKFAVRVLCVFALVSQIPVIVLAKCGSIAQQLDRELAPLLSSPGLISQLAPPRWSSFDAPTPGAVVSVETELDVAITVCTISSG